MENNYNRQILRMQQLKETYAIFSQGTKLPFVICDEETYNDQVWVFVDEDKAKEFAKTRAEENQDMLTVIKLENQQLLPFYSSLYPQGVNEVVLAEEEEITKIPLDKLVREPDYASLPEKKRPLVNPILKLTGAYFMQEIHRRKPNAEKPKLRELEEEMASNMVKSKYLVALEIEGGERKPDGSNIRIPCVKNANGKMFQPIFTDAGEFRKFNKENKFQASMVEFKNIQKIFGKEVEGIVVNPETLNIVVLKEKIPAILERFNMNEE